MDAGTVTLLISAKNVILHIQNTLKPIILRTVLKNAQSDLETIQRLHNVKNVKIVDVLNVMLQALSVHNVVLNIHFTKVNA